MTTYRLIIAIASLFLFAISSVSFATETIALQIDTIVLKESGTDHLSGIISELKKQDSRPLDYIILHNESKPKFTKHNKPCFHLNNGPCISRKFILSIKENKNLVTTSITIFKPAISKATDDQQIDSYIVNTDFSKNTTEKEKNASLHFDIARKIVSESLQQAKVYVEAILYKKDNDTEKKSGFGTMITGALASNLITSPGIAITNTSNDSNTHYTISGDYSLSKNKTLIQLKCINNENGNIISYHYTELGTPEPDLKEHFAEIALNITQRIEEDFKLKNKGPRRDFATLVMGKPSPYTWRNIELSHGIIKTINSKIKHTQFDKFIFKSDITNNLSVDSTSAQTWKTANKLNSTILFILDIDTFGNDFKMHLTKYDLILNSYSTISTDTHTITSDFADINMAINELLKKMHDDKWIDKDVSCQKETLNDRTCNIRFTPKNKEKSFKYAIGFTWHAEPELYLDPRLGLSFIASYTIYPWRQHPEWQLEFPRIKIDYQGSRYGGNHQVFGASISIDAAYNFNLISQNNMYAGISVGLPGIIRNATGDLSYAARAAAGYFIGWIHTYDDSSSIDIRLGRLYSNAAVESRILGTPALNYPGGHPGGTYLTIGTSF